MSNLHTAQKMKFSIKDFFSKCDQIRSCAVSTQSGLANVQKASKEVPSIYVE